MLRRAFLALGASLPAALVAGPAAADELADLRKKGVLRVGTSDDYAPFSKLTGDKRSGLDVDLVTLLGSDLGTKIEFVPFKWPELSARLEQGAFDVAASGVTVKVDRLLFGRFSRPYALTSAVVRFRKEDGARFRNPGDLNAASVRIAVNRGGHLEQVARTMFPRASLVLIDGNVGLFDRVVSRGADAAVTDDAEAHAADRPELGTLGPLTHDRKAFLVRRGAPGLARFLDQWLFKHETVKLPQLRRRWLGTVEPLSFQWQLEAVLTDVDMRLQLMPWVGAAKRATHLPLEDLAQEARVLQHVQELARDAELNGIQVESLYRVLIRAAKVIQLAPVTPAAPVATLEALRDVLGALDEHLLLCLKTAAPRVPPPEWQKGVAEGVRADLLPKGILQDIASALSAVHRVKA